MISGRIEKEFDEIKQQFKFLTKFYRGGAIYYHDLLKCCFAFHNLQRFETELSLNPITQEWFSMDVDQPESTIHSEYASTSIPQNIEPIVISLNNLPSTSIFNALKSPNDLLNNNNFNTM